jgi:hypothetical protein
MFRKWYALGSWPKLTIPARGGGGGALDNETGGSGEGLSETCTRVGGLFGALPSPSRSAILSRRRGGLPPPRVAPAVTFGIVIPVVRREAGLRRWGQK